MATILHPEDGHANIQACITAASNGDTISIADGTYTEQITTAAKVGLTIVSRGTDRTKVVIQSAANYQTVRLNYLCTMANLTIKYTGTGSSITDGYAIRGVTSTSSFILHNLYVESDWGGVRDMNHQCVIDRCHFRCTYLATGHHTFGMYSNYGAAGTTITATLLTDFNWGGIYFPTSVSANCTVYTSIVKNASMRGIYSFTHANNVAHLDNAANGWGGITGSGAGGTSSAYGLAWGWGSNDFRNITTITNELDTADVTADGNPVFVDQAALDLHLDGTGLAVGSGAPAGVTNDLDGVRFDTPPSRGCYEYVAGGASTTRAHQRCSLGLGLGL